MTARPPPPLLTRGFLAPPIPDQALKDELDKYIPIEYIIKWFRDRLRKTGVENRVVIIKSKTASGKSTIIPPRIFTDLVDNKERAGIICTQPKILTAIENVKDIIFRNPKTMRLGVNIGWLTQNNKLRPVNLALTSATIGTLTQQLISMTDEELMKTYKYILIDETHERDLQTDMTIYMLKNFVKRNKDNEKCPFVVLMSATFDPEPFLKYFSLSIETNYIECEGFGYEKIQMWDWNEGRTVSDYGMAAADIIYKIVKEGRESRNDIL
jgi:HrpA-like helicases